MIRKNTIYRYLLTVWLLWSCAASGFAIPSSTSSNASWGYRPLYETSSSPSYQFRSTSTCASAVGHTRYSAADVTVCGNKHNGPRKSPWDEDPSEDDLPIGVVPPPTPVGSPLILLLFALLYLFVPTTLRAQNNDKQPTVVSKKASNRQSVILTCDLHCQGCCDKIMKNIAWEKGVKDIVCNLKTKTVTVTFDPRKTDIPTLLKAFERIGKPAKVKAE